MLSRRQRRTIKKNLTPRILWSAIGVTMLIVALGVFAYLSSINTLNYSVADTAKKLAGIPVEPTLDKVAYDLKMLKLAHVSTTTIAELVRAPKPGETTLSSFTPESLASSTIGTWPTRAAYPLPGAILPEKRIVAYYGNFYSTRMGILGEFDEAEVLRRLQEEIAAWNAADPTTPVIPAIDYIALTAQDSAGGDGDYMFRMPDEHIERAVAMARKVNGIVILEMQLGLSTLQKELPMLEKYLKMPDVHLALDPEFAMHNGARPGTVVGSFDAKEINYAAQYLADLVKANNLPPKVLIVHRFTKNMVTNYQNIKPLPEVQVVMVMDGWGEPAKKKNTYERVTRPEPVQFTGFKVFYKNDMKPPSTRLMTPQEILDLTPSPSFIQYQ